MNPKGYHQFIYQLSIFMNRIPITYAKINNCLSENVGIGMFEVGYILQKKRISIPQRHCKGR